MRRIHNNYKFKNFSFVKLKVNIWWFIQLPNPCEAPSTFRTDYRCLRANYESLLFSAPVYHQPSLLLNNLLHKSQCMHNTSLLLHWSLSFNNALGVCLIVLSSEMFSSSNVHHICCHSNQVTFICTLNSIMLLYLPIGLESIMLQNLLIMIFWHFPNFCPLCSFLCFLGMHYADNLCL